MSSDEEADCGGGGASAGGSALPSAPGGVAVGGADKGKGKGYQTRDRHKKAVGPKGDSKGKPKRRSQKFTTERKHSAVATARVYMGKNDGLDNPANWLAEECFLPTGAITNTKGPTLGRFLFERMDAFIFGGKRLFEWALSLFRMTIASISFVFVGDKASSNEAFLNMVLAVIDIVSEKEDVLLTGFYEWCVLHGLGIIVATLLKRFQVGKHLYSLSRVLLMGKQHKALRKRLDALVSTELRFNDPAVHPADTPGRRGLLTSLWSVLACKWGKDPDDPEQQKYAHLKSMCDLFSMLAPEVEHTCGDTACQKGGHRACKDHNHAIKRAKRLLFNAFFLLKVPLYQTGRWLQLLPTLCWFATLFALPGKLGIRALSTLSLADQEGMEDLGKRLTSGIQWANHPQTVFVIILCLALAQRMEAVVQQVFDLSGDTDQGPTVRQHRRTGRKPFSDSHVIYKAIRRLQADLFTAIYEPEPDNAHGVPSWAIVAVTVWPQARPLEECWFMIVFASYIVMSEVEWRFSWDYSTFPHNLISLEGILGTESANSLRWSQAAFSLASNTCEHCFVPIAKAWRRTLRRIEDATRRAMALKSWYFGWAAALKKSTLQEEGWHRRQRSNRFDSHNERATGLLTQSVNNWWLGLWRSWRSHGCRNLDVPPPAVQKAYKSVTAKRQHTKYPRKNQKGRGAYLLWLWDPENANLTPAEMNNTMK